MSKIKAGDVVVAISGGPRMTVEAITLSVFPDEAPTASVAWFDDKDHLHRSRLFVRDLVVVPGKMDSVERPGRRGEALKK